MRHIVVVTVGRSDYGIYRPLLRALQADPAVRLSLLVGGMHLAEEFGATVRAIEADGFSIAARIEMLPAADTAAGVAAAQGRGLLGFAEAYARQRPDLLVVLGDRFEMHAAALAALPFKIPVAHLHGGELTEGAIDDALRHSLTKLSHLHFVATEDYARRVMQLGEEPWRVTVTGALGLDNLEGTPLLGLAALEERLGMELRPAPLLITFHPVSLELERTSTQVEELLAALAEFDRPLVFTQPNVDAGGRLIQQQIEAFVARHPRARQVLNLDTQAYFSLMAEAAAMVGNSSSGILEAPSFRLPVVNIGNRQQGRLRAANVIDVVNERREIAAAIRRAVSTAFRAGLRQLVNPFGRGNAAAVMLERLTQVPLDERLLKKRFHDLLPVAARQAG